MIDIILITLVVAPLMGWAYGAEYFTPGGEKPGFLSLHGFLNYVAPPIAAVAFWVYRAATPGKIAMGLWIVDAETYANLTPQQAMIRYVGYIPAGLVLGLGFFAVLWDPRRQGWHDRWAGSVVLRSRTRREMRLAEDAARPGFETRDGRMVVAPTRSGKGIVAILEIPEGMDTAWFDQDRV